MAYQTRPTLKGYFVANAEPTQVQFADLIDSMVYVAVSNPVMLDHGACLIPFVKSATYLDATYVGLAYNPDASSFMAGENPTATGNGSVAFGSDTFAEHDFSMAGGAGAKTRRNGERVWARGFNHSNGDAVIFDFSLPVNDYSDGKAYIQICPNEVLTASCIYTDVKGCGYVFTLFVEAGDSNILQFSIDKPMGVGGYLVKVARVDNIQDGLTLTIIPVLDGTDDRPTGHLSVWGSSVIKPNGGEGGDEAESP